MIVVALPVLAVVSVLLISGFAALLDESTLLQRYWIFMVLALVMSLAALRPYLALAHKIVVKEDAVDFHGLRSERSVRRGRAVSLRPTPAIPGSFQLVYEDGRVVFSSRFTGFHEVVTALKTQNPKLIIEGC